MYWVGDREDPRGPRRARQEGGRQGPHRHPGLVVLPRAGLGQPGHPGEDGPQDDDQVRPGGLTRPRWVCGCSAPARSPTSPCRTCPVGGEEPPTFFGAYGQWMVTPPPTWDDVAWLREQWDGPFCVKGITRIDDAKRAVDAGATAISVSNHGGNNLDSTPAPIRALPGDRRGRRRPGRGPARRRHPARQRRRQGPGARCPGRDDRARLPLGPGRQRPAPASRTSSRSCAAASARGSWASARARCTSSAPEDLIIPPNFTRQAVG